jgi:hypothetical protein
MAATDLCISYMKYWTDRNSLAGYVGLTHSEFIKTVFMKDGIC